MADPQPHIAVHELTLAYGDRVVLRDLDFSVKRGQVFIVMGGSGCGKSTVLRHLIGLGEPAKGDVFYGDVNFTRAAAGEREAILRRVGVLYQSGALWSSMTLAENVGFPLEGVHRSHPGRDQGRRLPQAGTGRPRRIRGLLPGGDQRWHAEASRVGPRHRAR